MKGIIRKGFIDATTELPCEFDVIKPSHEYAGGFKIRLVEGKKRPRWIAITWLKTKNGVIEHD